MFFTVPFLAVTAASALQLLMITGPLLRIAENQPAVGDEHQQAAGQPVITSATVSAQEIQPGKLRVISVITDKPVKAQPKQAVHVPLQSVVKPEAAQSAGTQRPRIHVQLQQANKSDKAKAINNEQAEIERRVQRLRNELVQAVRQDQNDEAAEIKQTLAALQKESKHLQQALRNLQNTESTASRIEVIEIERQGDQIPAIQQTSQQELKERRERGLHEREMHEREMREREMHERAVREQRERDELRLLEREAAGRKAAEGESHEQDPDQVMRRVIALHQAAEKLHQAGLQDMAHNLHQQAEEMEQHFHHMMKERAQAARGPRPDGPHHPDTVQHLAEQVERLRHEVRELHAKLDRMLHMMEEAHGK